MTASHSLRSLPELLASSQHPRSANLASMFGIGGGEFMVIALIALIAVGPEQLPSVMRKLGGYVAQVRSMADGVKSEFMSGMDGLDPTTWTGDGSDEKPIVPRGFADKTTSTSGSPAVKPQSRPASESKPDLATNPGSGDTPEGTLPTPLSEPAEAGPAGTGDEPAATTVADLTTGPATAASEQELPPS